MLITAADKEVFFNGRKTMRGLKVDREKRGFGEKDNGYYGITYGRERGWYGGGQTMSRASEPPLNRP